MLLRASAPESDSSRHNVRSTTYKQSQQVLITQDFISFEMNTYSVVEAALKTRYLKSVRINTYRKSPHNSLEMNTYKKTGVGG